MYEKISAAEIPAGLRWDVPPRNQGQIVEVAYADSTPGAGEAPPGARYQRVTDRSKPVGQQITYYRRA